MDNSTVGCVYCGQDIVLGVDDPNTLVDMPVYKSGELDYIEIAHKMCHDMNAYHASVETAAIAETGAPWRAQKMRQDAIEAARTVVPHVVKPGDDIPF
jgi:hypothetical protein